MAEMMAGRKVVIRTLDIGADKQAGYFGLEKEENPALGYRAIRICLERRDMFETQPEGDFKGSSIWKYIHYASDDCFGGGKSEVPGRL